MGTRSITVMVDGYDDTEIAVLYRQFDGYLSGHGKELADYLSEFTAITNGISGSEKGKIANGPACLAAQLIAYFKVGVGGFYLYPAGTRDCGEEYTYIVTATVGQPINLKVVEGYSTKKTIFDGPVGEFDIHKLEKEEN